MSCICKGMPESARLIPVRGKETAISFMVTTTVSQVPFTLYKVPVSSSVSSTLRVWSTRGFAYMVEVAVASMPIELQCF